MAHACMQYCERARDRSIKIASARIDPSQMPSRAPRISTVDPFNIQLGIIRKLDKRNKNACKHSPQAKHERFLSSQSRAQVACYRTNTVYSCRSLHTYHTLSRN